jgi:hypothetical protein
VFSVRRVSMWPTGAKVAIAAALVLGSVMLGYAAFLVHQIFAFFSHLHF